MGLSSSSASGCGAQKEDLSDKTGEVMAGINKQSPDTTGVHVGKDVKDEGAGDQGIMFGKSVMIAGTGDQGIMFGKDVMNAGTGDQGIMFGYAGEEGCASASEMQPS